MSFDIINGIHNRFTSYVDHKNDNHPYLQNDWSLDESSENPSVEESTDVRVGQDYKETSLSHLLYLTRVDAMHQSTVKMRKIQSDVTKTSQEFNGYKEALAELSTAYGMGSRTISLESHPKLQSSLKTIRRHDPANPLLRKLNLSHQEIDSLIKVVQHKASGIQQDLSQKQSEMNHTVTLRDTLFQGLFTLLQDLKQVSRKLFGG